MFQIVKNSWQDFKRAYKKYLMFGFIYMFITSFLFVPVISFIFNQMLKLLGKSSLLNGEVYTIGLNLTGFLGMSLILFLTVFLLLIQFGVIIHIAQKSYFQRNIFLTEAIITTVKKVPKILLFGFSPFILLLLLVIPYTETPFLSVLIDYNLPIILTNKLHGSYLSIVWDVLLILAVIYLLLRLLFTLHGIFIEGNSIVQAVKNSWVLTKNNKRTIILKLFVQNLIAWLTWFLFIRFISYVSVILHITFIQNYLLTISGLLTVMFSILFIPLNMIFITRMYYLRRGQLEGKIEDRLILVKNKKLTMLERKILVLFSKKKILTYLSVAIFIVGTFFINNTVNSKVIYLKWNVEVAAHRGDRHAPENSISSIKSAISHGVNAVEIDVRLTKDGVVVLNHDKDLKRVAGVPNQIKAMTFEELSQIDIGYGYPEYKGEHIPTLEEVLAIIQEEKAKLLIEIKTGNSDKILADKVVKLIEEKNLEDKCYIQSFGADVLTEVRKQNSEIKIGQILYLAAGNLSSIDVDFYTIKQSMLSERIIKDAHKHNRQVWVWTVNLERNIHEVLKYNIDGIITDYPEKVQKAFDISTSMNN